MTNASPVAALATLSLLLLAACGKSPDVRLYIALDQEHSEALMKRFAQSSGLVVGDEYDSENQKTVGLVSRIIEQAGRPRCDVFWNNEVAQTVRLAQRGLLEPYDSPAAADIPAEFRDPQHRWTGFAARARVLIVNTDLVPNRADWPTSMWDLIDPKWKGRVAVAQPLTGTTLSHFAALSVSMPAAEYERFVNGLIANEVHWLTSNGATMRHVGEGKLAFAFTDTDDYHVARAEKGFPVACVFPDQGDDQIGTMLLANTVAIVKGAPNPEAARKAVDFIVSREVETLLAAAKSAQLPVRTGIAPPGDPQVLPLGKFKRMKWDPEATASALEATSQRFGKLFGK